MEAITINTKKREKDIKNEVSRCLMEIKDNADEGKQTTKLYIPLHISSEVRSEIEKKLKESNTNYTFQIVRSSTNEFTGKIQQFSGMAIGNDMYYQIFIH